MISQAPAHSIVSTRTLAPPHPVIAAVPAHAHVDHGQKLELRARAQELDSRARAAAAAGEIDESARLILAALECERRLAATGPQVLQLIKSRS